MKGKKLSTYAAAFIITLFGAGATLLIVNAADMMSAETEYANIDPTSLETDFGS